MKSEQNRILSFFREQEKIDANKIINYKHEKTGKKFINRLNELEDGYNFSCIDRLEKCSSDMGLYWNADDNNIIIHSTLYNCRNPLCPFCNYKRARKESSRLYWLLNYGLEGEYCFLFLTLTIPSVSSDDLSLSIRKLQKDSKKLLDRYQMRKEPYGYYESLEITYNEKSGFHPHLHIVLAVPRQDIKYTYYQSYNGCLGIIDLQQNTRKGLLHITTAQLVRDWIDITGYSAVLSNGEQWLNVDLRPLRSKKAVLEVCKYALKTKELNNRESAIALYNALYRVHRVQRGGVLGWGSDREVAFKSYIEDKKAGMSPQIKQNFYFIHYQRKNDAFLQFISVEGKLILVGWYDYSGWHYSRADTIKRIMMRC